MNYNFDNGYSAKFDMPIKNYNFDKGYSTKAVVELYKMGVLTDSEYHKLRKRISKKNNENFDYKYYVNR